MIGFTIFVFSVLAALFWFFWLMVVGFGGERLAQTAVGVAFGGFLWVLKWLISGNKSLWPWKSSE